MPIDAITNIQPSETSPHTQDRPLLLETDNTRRLLAFTACYLARVKQDPLEILYPIMSSRNYKELNQKIIDYFPISHPPSQQDLATIQDQLNSFDHLYPQRAPDYRNTVNQIIDSKKNLPS